MSNRTQVTINTSESFPSLRRAPIVEAVIDLRVVTTEKLEEKSCRSKMERLLAGYHFLDQQRQYQAETNFEGGKPASKGFVDLGWKGVRFESDDQTQIVQFNLDGFAFSQLAPYSGWERLIGEVSHLWQEYKILAKPSKVERVGLRFINRIQLPVSEFGFESYLHAPPVSPVNLDLPFRAFVHQEMLAVPDHQYSINVIKTIQPPEVSGDGRVGLILDIDVFTDLACDVDDTIILERLSEMRWLKNKVFFGSITEKALEYLR